MLCARPQPREPPCLSGKLRRELFAQALGQLCSPELHLPSEGSAYIYLRALVQMFHAILVDEYHPNQNQFTTTWEVESHADFVSCDFCGCDILVSFFQCTACEGNGAVEAGFGEDVHLCSGCVAEARACACGREMTPMQRWPYERLRSSYNTAVRILLAPEWRELGARCVDTIFRPPVFSDSGTAKIHAQLPASSRQLCSSTESTCYGQGTRYVPLENFHLSFSCSEGELDQSVIKCYYAGGRDSHEVKAEHVVPCTPCHRGRCFLHWAEKGAHSSVIAIALGRGDKCITWHRQHQSLKQVFDKGRLLAAEEAGDAVVAGEMPGRLALLCTTFSYVSPLRRGLQTGYYDVSYIDVPSSV
jgi:hypothetical protein